MISLKQNKILTSFLEKYICKINNKLEEKGTGFFCKMPFPDQFKLLPVLITNNHFLDEDNIKVNNIIKLSLDNDKIYKNIEISNTRKVYTNKDLDITIIEVYPNEDKIDDYYLDIDDYKNNNYKDEEICILQYPNGLEGASYSIGKLENIDNEDIYHNCSTKFGSSGGPIINLSNNKVIGIHKGTTNSNSNINKGTFIKYAIEEFNKKYPQNNNKINISNISKHQNCILAEIYINDYEVNMDIRIINSYEESKRENKKHLKFAEETRKEKRYNLLALDLKYYFMMGVKNELEGDKNEKEIKKNCKIKIDNKLISFSYFHKFKTSGKHIIEYNFKYNLTNTNFMFYKCCNLTNLDLSNFNNENVINMEYMFCCCRDLANINLLNINTIKATNMERMFSGCIALSNLDLSSFNTENVKNMKYMFFRCNSLKDLNISNFNAKNVIDMKDMFSGCESLTNLNISKFDEQSYANIIKEFKNKRNEYEVYFCEFILKNQKYSY